MKIKFLPLTAALVLTLAACQTTNDPLEVKIDGVLSEKDEINSKADVNNDLLGENSVENVENPIDSQEPAVENSPDSGTSETESDENHAFVNDSAPADGEISTDPAAETEDSEKLSTTDPQNVENLTPDDIFYIDEVPHIRRNIRSHPPGLVCSSFPVITEDIQNIPIILIGKVVCYDGDNYDACYSEPKPSEDFVYLSDRIPMKIEIIQVLKDETSTVSDLSTVTVYHSGGELTLEQYKKYVSSGFQIELYPENTVVECSFGGMDIPLSGETYLFFIKPEGNIEEKTYSNYYGFDFFQIENGRIIYGVHDLGSLDELFEMN